MSEKPPFRHFEVEIWQKGDKISGYDFKKIYGLTAPSAVEYQAEDVSKDIYGGKTDKRVLTRQTGKTRQITVESHEKELYRFAEGIIESVEEES